MSERGAGARTDLTSASSLRPGGAGRGLELGGGGPFLEGAGEQGGRGAGEQGSRGGRG